MQPALNIPKNAALDLVSLGALVHRLDPGIIPFRKATECQIHVSGGEFNCAANLADCFGLQYGLVNPWYFARCSTALQIFDKAVIQPYFAPDAHIPTTSCAPRFAAMNARLVIHTGTDRCEVRKSALVSTLRRIRNPMPSTKTKYKARTT